MFRSLRSRLVILLALALLPAVVLSLFQALDSYRQTTELAEHSVLRRAAIAASDEQNAIVAAHQMLEVLARLPEIFSPTPSGCDDTLTRVKASDARYGNLAVMNLSGDIICSTTQEKTPNFAQAAWFLQTLEDNEFTVSGAIDQQITDEPIFVAALPLKDDSGVPFGMIAVSLKQAWLRELILRTNLSPDTHIALLDRNGDLLAEEPGQESSSDWFPKAPNFQEALGESSRIFEQESRDGITRLFAVAPVYQDQVFVVFAGIPSQLIRGREFRLLTGIGYPILMWIIAVAVAWLAVDRLVLRGILALRQTAQAYSRGEFEARTANIDSTSEELKELGVTLHRMADAISQHESELRNSLDEQKSLLAEVYHRVKNNLQVMSSLLSLQISRSDAATEKAALSATQNRIHALATVHSSLYEAGGLHSLSCDQFIPQLCRNLFTAQINKNEGLQLKFDVEPVRCEPDQAIPLALLVTEALSAVLGRLNPDQTPAPGGGKSSLTVKLVGGRVEGALSLSIVGQGLALGEKPKDDLSDKLVRSFAQQLHATLSIIDDGEFRLHLDVSGQG